ncbi:MAG: M48 family metalloprotease [Pseudomonadota bacterium]
MQDSMMRNVLLHVGGFLTVLALALVVFSSSAIAREEQSCPFNQAQSLLSKLRLPRLPSQVELQQGIPAPFQGLGKTRLAHSPSSQTYIKRIANHLMTHSDRESPAQMPYYRVRSRYAYQAEALLDYSIVVDFGLLDLAASDDEVAFIVGHELGHILLGHMDEQDTLRRAMNQLALLQKGSAYLSDIAQVEVEPDSLDESTEEIRESIQEHNVRIQNFVDELKENLENLAKPLWTAAQEDEADLFAAELLLRGGFSPRGAAQSLNRMKDSSENLCADLVSMLEELDGYREEFVTKSWADLIELQDPSNSWKMLSKPLKERAEEKLRKALLAASIPQTHRPWDKRKKILAEYFKSEEARSLIAEGRGRWASDSQLDGLKNSADFRRLRSHTEAIKLARRSFIVDDISAAESAIAKIDMRTSEGRILKRRLRRSQGNDEAAVENLRLALRAEQPALQVYEDYLADILKLGAINESQQIVERAQEQFQDNKHFLPEKIYVEHIALDLNDDDEATIDESADRYMQECLGVARADIWDVCRAARTGLSPEFREKSKAILALEDCPTGDCKGGNFGRWLKGLRLPTKSEERSAESI